MDEPSYLNDTRAAYDTVASTYADILRRELDRMPVDRAMLTVFAELVTVMAVDASPTSGAAQGE